MSTRTLLVIGAAAALLLTARWLVARVEPGLTFFPTRGETATPRTMGLDYRPLEVHTADGETIAAWWIPHPDARADVVYFHGNGGNLSIWLPILAGVQASGANVLAVDYRGYGRSTGRPTEKGLYRDADAVLLELDRLRGADGAAGGERRPVVYWGRSLGSAVAAYAAGRKPPDGLILESAFDEKAAIIRGNPVLRVLNLLAAYRFETARMLRGYAGPTLVMHGDADRVVPYAAGRELFEQLQGQKQFVTLRGADHNDLFPATAREYWQAVEDLMRLAGLRAEG